jgi:hypothetical protein
MLRAIIRSGNDALHFIGDLNGYNLQTLQMHARGALRESGCVQVELELEECDATTWKHFERGWLARMDRAGVDVLVHAETCEPPAASPPPEVVRREPVVAA